jgi:hypothetical protein
MVNYGNGKIYKIESHLGDKIYIGSTTKEYLSQRMDNHRGNYKVWKSGQRNKTTSFELFDEYGIENCQIVLLELCPCNSRDELTSREAHFIRTLECVNKRIEGRTQKEWTKVNKDKIRERMRSYDKQKYQDNKEAIIEKKKQYRKDNIDKMREYNKLKQAEYKEKISERNKQIYSCECGISCNYSSKGKHIKTIKHKTYLESLESN